MSEPLHLFAATGVELEYMIVDAETLDVLPICDRVLGAVGDGWEREVDRGVTAWSNELALHVIETKCNGPVASLHGLPSAFAEDVRAINGLLQPHGAMLLPSAMHPWMDPARETRLWPHEDDVIYRTFDRIFGCSGHGWSNLQSVHINLPFCGDAEFAALHDAIRVILPILPALSASSPVVEGRLTGRLDNRLGFYRTNAAKVPSVSGRVVPERYADRAAYEAMLLGIRDDLAPHDPDGVLEKEWVNARGAIARFDRMAIEIRVLDIAECPTADLAVVAAIRAVLQALVAGSLGDLGAVGRCSTEALATTLQRVEHHGERATIDDPALCATLGVPVGRSAQAVWQQLVAATADAHAAMPWRAALDTILDRGPLARRVVQALPQPSEDGVVPREALREVWRTLAAHLAEDRVFTD
ncbi:MAG: glutamate--cysteine ligase [Deltaproteobacteria bacterium]|nr:glutamate--cysteine ligase [Deltaproteobacteria bacterium]